MKEILKEFVDNVCSICKGKCDKGITFVYSNHKTVKCVDYIKDESKINKLKKELETTAKKEKPLMKGLV